MAFFYIICVSCVFVYTCVYGRSCVFVCWVCVSMCVFFLFVCLSRLIQIDEDFISGSFSLLMVCRVAKYFYECTGSIIYLAWFVYEINELTAIHYELYQHLGQGLWRTLSWDRDLRMELVMLKRKSNLFLYIVYIYQRIVENKRLVCLLADFGVTLVSMSG